MSLIRQLSGFLQSNGHGTVGTDIFVEDMPYSPANSLMVMSNVSPAPDDYIDTETLNFEVWCRNESTKTASDKLSAVKVLLHRFYHLTLGEYYIYYIGATGNIENLTKDVDNRSLQKINFRAIYRNNNSVS